MKLIDMLKSIKEVVDENPAALEMEVMGVDGASGAVNNIGYSYIKDISDWDDSEYCLREMLPKDYPFNKIIELYIGD